jgi:ABC-type polar amino acid transport system ATPase subunit
MKVSKLSKTYGGKKVLSIDAFSFQSDTIYAVVGPTAAARARWADRAGLLEPDSDGCISFGGARRWATCRSRATGSK